MQKKKAWAIVNKKNPVINTNEIFDSKEVAIDKTEKFIRVEIKEII